MRMYAANFMGIGKETQKFWELMLLDDVMTHEKMRKLVLTCFSCRYMGKYCFSPIQCFKTYEFPAIFFNYF